MSKKSDVRHRARLASPNAISQAMALRVRQRMAVNGSFKIPAVPSLADKYVEVCSQIFAACGRPFAASEVNAARTLIAEKLASAYRGSPRSKLTIHFEADAGHPLGYSIAEEVSTIADAYERWVGTSEGPLFGAHPDARVLEAASALDDPASPILDLGAGTGRNALPLAERGFVVDAVELTPKFAEMLANEASRRQLPVRVIAEDIFQASQALRRDYRLFFASEVVPDFRSPSDLRRLLELAAQVLVEGGILLFNVHLGVPGFTPDRAAREFAQQCYSALFTTGEVKAALAGLPFDWESNDSVYEFEHQHLPPQAWPPTPWFVNWVSGLDVYDLERGHSPVELRWLSFRRTRAAPPGPLAKAPGPVAPALARTAHSRPFDPPALRQALVRRLMRRAVASGTITLPAIPALAANYVNGCFAIFTALGRPFDSEQLAHARDLFERALEQAFAASPRSNIVVTYEVMMGTEIRYTVTADPVSIAQGYSDWFEDLGESIFGIAPDARVVTLLKDLERPGAILDVGAGTGRNAFYLAEQGYRVDAIELTPKFAEWLVSRANRDGRVRVIAGDVFDGQTQLGQDYALILLSGVAGDFRGVAQLRRIFELACQWLKPGGRLVLNLHVVKDGHTPDAAARQWAQQCCATLFSKDDVAGALTGLPLAVMADDVAFDFERAHLPAEDWPPTPAYAEWATGQHLYALDQGQCPIELRWLVITRAAHSPERGSP